MIMIIQLQKKETQFRGLQSKYNEPKYFETLLLFS